MASEHTHREIPRPAPWPLENLTKIAAQNLDGFLFMAYLLSRMAVPTNSEGEVIAELFNSSSQRSQIASKTGLFALAVSVPVVKRCAFLSQYRKSGDVRPSIGLDLRPCGVPL